MFKSLTFQIIIIVIILFFLAYRKVYRSGKKSGRATMTIPQAFENLETGDLILFSYRSQRPWVNALSYFYQTLLQTEWTHVGLIIKINGIPYVAESTAREQKHQKYGYADLNPLENRLHTYQGKIAFRKLNKTVSLEAEQRLRAYLHASLGVPFEDNVEKHVIHRCFLSACPPCQKAFKSLTNLPERKGFFCTEFVQILMKEAGIIDSNYHIPDHCSLPLHYTDFNQTMKLSPGYAYSSEIDLIK